MRELQDLNQLEGKLSILDLGKVVDVDEVVKANLKSKKRLTCLELIFDGRNNDLINHQFAILEALEGPSELEELSISSYTGELLPNWIISLTNLTKLELINCGRFTVDVVVALARLPSLEDLQLESIKVRKYNLGDEKEEEKGGTSSMVAKFPKLKKLYLTDIWSLEKSFLAATEMPQLTSFSIDRCPDIEELPNCILRAPQLQSLIIHNCPILKERYNKESGKYWSKISHIPKVKLAYYNSFE